MTSIITYQPDESFSIDGVLLFWDTRREETRKLLNSYYESNDNVIDLSEHYKGDISNNIIQRRDIYKNFRGGSNLFLLNFDTNDKLQELEIHHGFEIIIQSTSITFSQNIGDIVQSLKNVSNSLTKLSEGEFYFPELKLTIANSNAIGGEGNNLAYFYCSKNSDHLL